MPLAASDRALRTMVAKLARARPADVEAVLAAMTDEHRSRVRRLLSEYLGAPQRPLIGADPPTPNGTLQLGLGQVSPWLAARAARAQGSETQNARSERRRPASLDEAAALRFSLSTQAHEALRASIATLGSPAEDAGRLPTSSAGSRRSAWR